jgi:hypothetical protein
MSRKLIALAAVVLVAGGGALSGYLTHWWGLEPHSYATASKACQNDLSGVKNMGEVLASPAASNLNQFALGVTKGILRDDLRSARKDCRAGWQHWPVSSIPSKP